MTELSKNSTVEHTQALLIRYGFDLDGYEADQLATQWAHHYQVRWICSAVVEALYQGRYKAISVEQILLFWERRGEPICHFNRDFERIIRGHSASGLATKPDVQPLAPSEVSETETEISAVTPLPESSSAGWFTHPPFSPNPQPSLLQVKADSSELVGTQETVAPDLAALFSPDPPASVPTMTDDSVEPADVAHIPTENLPHSLDQIDSIELVTPSTAPHSGNAPNFSTFEPIENSEPTLTSEPAAVSQTESKFPTRAFRFPLRPIRADVYQADWSRCQVSQRPIGRFVPAPELSEFYTKLKSVAQKVSSPESGVG